MLLLKEELTIPRNVTYTYVFYVMDNLANPVNISGYRAVMHLKKKVDDFKVLDDYSSYLDHVSRAEHGEILLNIPYQDTGSLMYGSAVFDVKIQKTDSEPYEVYRVATGTIYIEETVTSIDDDYIPGA